MKLYVFSIRDVRNDGITKYPGLIPKLRPDMNMGGYGPEGPTIGDIYDLSRINKECNLELFYEILMDKDNLLYESEYLSPIDKIKLIFYNLKYFTDENMTKPDMKRFIDHLHQGHPSMEYGLYFGLRKANNDKELLEFIRQTHPQDKNQNLIFYTELSRLTDFIEKTQVEMKFDEALLYFNDGWKYGKRDKGSAEYNPSYKKPFFDHLLSQENDKLELYELICRIPLAPELFRHSYRSKAATKKIKKHKKSKKKSKKNSKKIKDN